MAHGLGAVPTFMIVKNRDATTDWAVYHRYASSAGNDSYLELNTNDAVATAGTVWNDTTPTSTVFTVGSNTKTNTDGEKYIAYVFTPIQGYSRFGSYTGNANVDGPFVYTGFKPSLVIQKDTTGNNWAIFDSARDTYNGMDKRLQPSSNAAESTESPACYDFLSNGFKLRTTDGQFNKNATTHIYMAFAEHPFASSEGVPATAR